MHDETPEPPPIPGMRSLGFHRVITGTVRADDPDAWERAEIVAAYRDADGLVYIVIPYGDREVISTRRDDAPGGAHHIAPATERGVFTVARAVNPATFRRWVRQATDHPNPA